MWNARLPGHLDRALQHWNQAYGQQDESLAIATRLIMGPDRNPQQADPQRVLATNRGHWSIENSCHYIIDWNYDENRSRIRKGHGPENITRLRRFAISIIKSKGARSVPQKMRQLMGNVRLVFDYLRMTENSCACALRD